MREASTAGDRATRWLRRALVACSLLLAAAFALRALGLAPFVRNKDPYSLGGLEVAGAASIAILREPRLTRNSASEPVKAYAKVSIAIEAPPIGREGDCWLLLPFGTPNDWRSKEREKASDLIWFGGKAIPAAFFHGRGAESFPVVTPMLDRTSYGLHDDSGALETFAVFNASPRVELRLNATVEFKIPSEGLRPGSFDVDVVERRALRELSWLESFDVFYYSSLEAMVDDLALARNGDRGFFRMREKDEYAARSPSYGMTTDSALTALGLRAEVARIEDGRAVDESGDPLPEGSGLFASLHGLQVLKLAEIMRERIDRGDPSVGVIRVTFPGIAIHRRKVP